MDPSGEEDDARPVVRIEITLRTMLTAVAVGAGVWLFVKIWPVILILVVALILVGTLNPLVALLERRRMKRGLAIGVVFVALLAGVGLVSALVFPPLVAQIARFVGNAPALQAHAADFLAKHRITESAAESLRKGGSSEFMLGALRQVVAYSPHILEVATYVIATVFLALYLMIDRDRVRGAVYALVPREYHLRLARVSLNLETIVGGYVRGQIITSAGMGIFVFGVLSFAHVPNAMALAVFGGLADVIPYLGAFLTVVPAVIAAFAAHGSSAAIVVFVALMIYEEIEGRVLIPRVYGHTLRLPSSAVLLALLVGGTLMGVLGALLALPIAAGIRMLVHELRLELPGEAVDETRAAKVRKRDARVEQAYQKLTENAPAEDAAAVAVELAEKTRKVEGKSTAEVAHEPLTSGKGGKSEG